MNRTFDFYEYAGVIVPGSILLLGAEWLLPEAKLLLGANGVTFGELGLFVIVAYAVGQLVQGVGNFIEWLFWKPLGGLPNRKLLVGVLLSTSQHLRLVKRLQDNRLVLGDPATLTDSEVRAVVREVYVHVSAAGRANRIDTFNGTYGLLRGVAAALLVIVVGAIAEGEVAAVVVSLATAFALALQRMHRFAVLYSRELFIAYISLAALA